ncbi:TFIIH subunit Tfb1/p62 domain-containing protein [Rozella allomycis CSF55]|uniref:TFIIH subunit Tfb1/p62 domain-containing protein n=1 Tax=Rozella allomycis (strain CSF55) TaxID=988480 RepID=A0A075AY18_ROZAC|nr:TFIIH subunit Tfb1/p62 domain-containing protein [Rozella allomycis CSF55]|eukprot:EPZ33577.1 TFIIH subunit Tfb1/p62 domain-containing protein [Rozella allomycis CSF55]
MQDGEKRLGVFNVLYKKRSGKLHVFNLQLKWSLEDESVYEVLLNYKDIKSHAVNPSKDKPMIKILTEKESYIFTFISGVEERDHVKELITKYLRIGKGMNPIITDKEVRLRLLVLKKYPELARLREELVSNKVMTEDEFWETRQNILLQESIEENQKRGIPGSVLKELKPTTTDDQTIRFSITPIKMQTIFAQYPSLHKMYKEMVPNKISEREFWTLYSQSKFIHGENASNKNAIFDSCYEKDSKMNLSDMTKEIGKWSDVSKTENDYSPEIIDFEKESRIQASLKRFNKQSLALLNSTTNKTSSNDERDSLIIEDLVPSKDDNFIPLTFSNNPLNKNSISSKITKEDINSYLNKLKKELQNPSFSFQTAAGYDEMRNLNLIPPSNIDLRKETSKIIMGYRKVISKIPNFPYDEVVAFHNKTMEVLRHFWSTFPLNSQDKVEKNQKMVQVIESLMEGYNEWINSGEERRSIFENLLRNTYSSMLKAIEKGYAVHNLPSTN